MCLETKIWSKFITFFISINKFFTGAFSQQKKKNISRKMKKKKRFWVLDIWWDFLLCKWNLLKKKKRCDQKILYNLLMKFSSSSSLFSYWIIWIWFSFVRLLNICFLFLTQAKKIYVWENIFCVVRFCFIVFSIYILCKFYRGNSGKYNHILHIFSLHNR